MPNAISAIIGTILLVLVMFYVPAYQTFEKQEDITYHNAYQAVTEFVDNVRFKGYITPKMYEDFQEKLHLGDVLFDVEIVHRHKIYTPVYIEPSNLNSFTGEYIVDYDEYYWEQIEPKLFDESEGPYEERMYKLESGDYFEVYVENKTKFKSTMLFEFLTGNIGDDNRVEISIPYGGMVLNEDY